MRQPRLHTRSTSTMNRTNLLFLFMVSAVVLYVVFNLFTWPRDGDSTLNSAVRRRNPKDAALNSEQSEGFDIDDVEAEPIQKRAKRSLYDEASAKSSLRWAHAVNSLEELAQVIESEDYEAIEFDIMTHPTRHEAVIGHPPKYTEVTLRQYLNRYHDWDFRLFKKFVLKFDFKDLEAVKQGAPVVEKFIKSFLIHNRVFINADILCGKKGCDLPMDAEKFLEAAQSIQQPFVLSLGWKMEEKECRYDDDMITEMANLVKTKVRPDIPISFVVKAECAMLYAGQLQTLTSLSHLYDITVWAPKDRKVMDDVNTVWLYNSVEGRRALCGKTYYDIPQFHEILAAARSRNQLSLPACA